MKFCWLDEENRTDEIMEKMERTYKEAWRTVLEKLEAYTEAYETDRSIWGKEHFLSMMKDGSRMLMVCKDNEVVGLVLTTLTEHKGEKAVRLNRLAVLPSCRKQGIGEGIIKECADEYRRYGVVWMTLHTSEMLIPLVRFYKDQGFEEWSREKISQYQKNYERVYLNKRL